MNRLLDDPTRLRAMGLRSRERVVEHFSWTGIARQTAEFYRELLAGR